jgi:hypothetical protein
MPIRRKRCGIYPFPLRLRGALRYNAVFTLLKILKTKSNFSICTCGVCIWQRNPCARITNAIRWILCRETLKQLRYSGSHRNVRCCVNLSRSRFLFAVFCCSKGRHCSRSTSQKNEISETKSLYVSSHNSNVCAVAVPAVWSTYWHVYVFGPVYFIWPWESHRTVRDVTPGSLSVTDTCIVYHVTHFEASRNFILHTRYVSTCVVAGCRRGVGKQRNKVNVYLPSLTL